MPTFADFGFFDFFFKIFFIFVFQVPFIAFYRKEYVEPDLHINDLWKVWHWDEKVENYLVM